MATLRTRGPRNARRVYVRYEYVRDGVRQQLERKLDGIANPSSYEAKQELARIEREVQAGRDPFPPPAPVKAVGALLEQFRDGLTNRSAVDDRCRINLHLLPRWKDHQLDAVALPDVMDWIDDLAGGELSVQTQRHLVNLLSRFFSWCILRGLATINPVKMIPNGAKPAPRAVSDGPWLEDDSLVPKLMTTLGGDLGTMFYLCNRAGVRLGEVCGLRMGDLEWLKDGTIRVGHSYDGPLKEDRRGVGKVKWVPAPDDIEEHLGMHLKIRKLQGAKADDLVFVAPVRENGRPRVSSWLGYKREYVDDQWREAAKACGVALTWYEATRHTFVTRALKAGVTLDEVSAAVGHSMPSVTKRHYDHYVRKEFSPALRRGLG